MTHETHEPCEAAAFFRRTTTAPALPAMPDLSTLPPGPANLVEDAITHPDDSPPLSRAHAEASLEGDSGSVSAGEASESEVGYVYSANEAKREAQD